MNKPRANHAAILLDDDRVMVIGGQSGYAVSVLSSTEFFDPATDSWTLGPSMHTPRYDFPHVRLSDGRILVAGGRGSGKRDLRDAELYDPRTGSWSATGALTEARSSHAMALLPDGRVLAAGGYLDGLTLASCEIYDPDTESWSPGPSMRRSRQSYTLVVLKNGRILAAGGVAAPDASLNSAEIYDPATQSWSLTGSLTERRGNYAVFLLPDGRVLAAGGVPSAGSRFPTRSEIYDPISGTWTPHAGPSAGFTPAYALVNGRPTLFGGYHAEPMNRVEDFDLSRGIWRALPPMTKGRIYFTLTPLRDGRYLAAGGETGPRAINSVELLHPAGLPARELQVAYEPQRVQESSSRPTHRRVERPDDYAVVIGVERYRALPAAAYAENDASSIATALQSLGVPEENTVVLRGARAGLTEIAKYVEEWLPRRSVKASRVYIFFSGHGAPDIETGVPYLMPWDGDAAFVKSTGFSLDRLYGALEKLPAREVIVALDSCFSGSGGRSVLAPGLRPLVNVRMPAAAPRKISILAASEANEAAGGLPSASHGAFSYRVIEGLNGAADKDGDGHLTLAELHAYARKHVILDARAQNREQTPTLSAPDPGLRLY